MVAGLFIVDPCGCENSRGAKVRFGMPTISIRWQQHKHQHRITPTSCKVQRGPTSKVWSLQNEKCNGTLLLSNFGNGKSIHQNGLSVRKCFNVLWHAKHAKLILESSLWCLKQIDVRLPEDTEFINWRKIAGTSRPEPFGTKCVCVCNCLEWLRQDNWYPRTKINQGFVALGLAFFWPKQV